MQMQSNTALALFFSGVSVLTFRIRHRTYRNLAKATLFLIVSIIFLNSLQIVYTDGEVNALNYFLVNRSNADNVFPVSPQSIVAIMLLSLIPLFNLKNNAVASVTHDFLVSIAFVLVTFYIAAHIFHATDLVSVDANVLLSVYTLIALVLLTIFNQISKCTPGLYSIFLMSGTGGEHCRTFVFPAIFLLFFVMTIIHNQLSQGNIDETEAFAVATAFVLSSIALLLIYLSYEINKLEWRLREQATTDELTRLLNRRGFKLFAEMAINESRRTKLPLTLLFFDLDNLKSINDRLGHKEGSEMIKLFADSLQSAFRESDVIARVGGDEFIVLVRDSKASEGILINRLNAHISNLAIPRLFPKYSYGVAEILPTTLDSLDDVINKADENMYKAKMKKKNEDAQ